MSERLRAPRPMRRRPDYGQVSSNHFVKQPFVQGQRTQVQLWGRLPLNSDDDAEELGSDWWRSFADSQDEEREDEGVVHVGTLLEKLSHIAVVSVAVGAGHVIILGEGGRVFAYGRNQRGQLGLGDTSERFQPTALPPLSRGPAEQAPGLDGDEADDWSIAGVACGTEHTLFLVQNRVSSLESWVFASGAADMLGCDGASADSLLPRAVPGTLGAAAVAARRRSSCCSCTVGASPRDASRRSGRPSFETPDEPAPDEPRSCTDAPANQEPPMSGRPSLASHPSTPVVLRPTVLPAEALAPPLGESVLYFWGEFLCDVGVARASKACDFFDAPEAVFRLPKASRKLALGGHFGLALDVEGAVYAWGDHTYGELGGAAAPSWAPAPEAAPPGPEHHWRSLPVPGKVQLPEGAWLEQPVSPAPRAKSSCISGNSTPAMTPMTPSPDAVGQAPTGGEASGRAVTTNSASRAGTALTPGMTLTPATPESLGRAGTNSSLRRALSRGLGRAASFTSTTSSTRRQRRIPSKTSARSADSHRRLRPAEAVARQPPSPSVPPCPVRHPRVDDVACGERHALLLDERGFVFAFGDNVAGQCGVPQAVGASHGGGSTVSRPSQVLLQPPRRGSRHFDAGNERGAGVFAGDRHSGVVTSTHRLYLWGHPSNHKLGDVGFNLDGTEAGEDPSKPRPPGVAVRSGLRDAARRPRLVYSQLHRKVHTLGLGEDCTLIVTGDGGGRRGQVAASEESVSQMSRQGSTETPEVEAERSDAALQI